MALVDYSDSTSDSSSSDEQLSRRIAGFPVHKLARHQPTSTPSPSNVDPINPSSSPAVLAAPAPAPAPPSISLPALPQSFHSHYASNVRTGTQDDPRLHSGRVRQTPHIQGSWPTHIYLEWFPSPAERETLNRLITAASRSFNMAKADNATTEPSCRVYSLLNSPLSVPLPLHISLSRPLTLQTEQKVLFHEALRSRIRSSTFRSLSAQLEERSDWVPNFDRSRWFLVLRVIQGGEGEDNDEDELETGVLNRLLCLCNDVVTSFEMGKLYDDEGNCNYTSKPSGKKTRPESVRPAKKRRTESGSISGDHAQVKRRSSNQVKNPFHVSIAWTLSDPNTTATKGQIPVSDGLKPVPGSAGEAREAETKQKQKHQHGRGTGTDMEEGKRQEEEEEAASKMSMPTPSFDVVKLKIGNVVHDISLTLSKPL